MNFKNKICVVTGGANGIGRRIVREFADLDRPAGERVLIYPSKNEHFV